MHHFDKLSEAASILSKEQTINEINQYVNSKTAAKISLCYPTRATQKNVIHFVLQGDKQLSARSLAEIASFIQNKINYDFSVEEDYLLVLDRELFSEDKSSQRFNTEILYTQENLHKIKDLFSKQFGYMSAVENNPSQNDLIEKHGISSPFWGKEEVEELDPNAVIECLKSNPKVFNALKSSPNMWDKISKPIQEKLKAAQAISPAPVTATGSPTEIRVK